MPASVGDRQARIFELENITPADAGVMLIELTSSCEVCWSRDHANSATDESEEQTDFWVTLESPIFPVER